MTQCIVQQVAQHLRDPVGIDAYRHLVLALSVQFDALFEVAGTGDLTGSAHNLTDPYLSKLQVEGVLLRGRCEPDISREPLQALDLSAHDLEGVRVRCQDSVLETIDMSLQGGQRRPDLMSEIRQEPGTGLVGAGQVLGHLLESDGQVRQLPAEAVVGDGDLPSACSNLDRGVGQILDGSTHPASDEPGEKDSCQHSDRCRSQ